MLDMVHVANEQERNDWSSDTPKSSDVHLHRKPNSRNKHPSGSNVSFSKDTEGGEEEAATQVRYAKADAVSLSVSCRTGCVMCRKSPAHPPFQVRGWQDLADLYEFSKERCS